MQYNSLKDLDSIRIFIPGFTYERFEDIYREFYLYGVVIHMLGNRPCLASRFIKKNRIMLSDIDSEKGLKICIDEKNELTRFWIATRKTPPDEVVLFETPSRKIILWGKDVSLEDANRFAHIAPQIRNRFLEFLFTVD